MKVRILLFIACSLLFFIFGSLVGRAIIEDSLHYRDSRQQYAHELNYQKRLLKTDEYLMGNSAWETKKNVAEQYNQLAENSESAVKKQSILYVCVASAYLLIIFCLATWKTRFSPPLLTSGLVLVALQLLYVGVCSPMLEIAAFEVDLTIPFEIDTRILGVLEFSKVFHGEMFFYYQSKSVLELITLLFANKNMVVAVSILVFTVVVPFVKLTASLLLVLVPSCRRSSILKILAFHISKWSMADVFVVATFLAYLSFNNVSTGIKTESHCLTGLYFFLGYCILSLIATLACEKTMFTREFVEVASS